MNTSLLKQATEFVAETLELTEGWEIGYIGTGYLTTHTNDGLEAEVFKVSTIEDLHDGVTKVSAESIEFFSRGETSHTDAERLATELDTKLIFQ